MNLIDREDPVPVERLSGVLVEWNDDRGFGWVEVNGKRRFAHIRDFAQKSRRPKVGDELIFVPGKDAKGRDCALDLRFAGAGAPGLGLGSWLFLLLLLALPLAAGTKVTSAPWIVAAWLAMASRMSWLQYSFDKERAQSGMARISEATLLGADLLGGWPGGFLAQRKLRHKTRKPGFQFVFWVIVSLWVAGAYAVVDQRWIPELVRLLPEAR